MKKSKKTAINAKHSVDKKVLTGFFNANSFLILDIENEVTKVFLALDFVESILDLFADFDT